MREVVVYFSDGSRICTQVNGTDVQVKAYYLNNTFNVSQHGPGTCTAIRVLVDPLAIAIDEAMRGEWL